jgi:hypothetical protein
VLAGFSTTLRYGKFTLLQHGWCFRILIYNNTATHYQYCGIEQGRNIDVAAYNSEEVYQQWCGASPVFRKR